MAVSDSALTLKVRGRVRVTADFIATMNSTHPHAGKTGVITEFLGVRLRGEDWPARAMVRLDDGTGIAIVSLQYLEPLP
jgi:hypothetical protein